MLAWLLVACGEDPSYIIGGVSKNLNNNAHAGRGQAFVIEADEYDRMFLGLSPQIAVVTMMEHDHPDCFPTAQEYYDAFAAFVRRLQPGGLLLTSADDPHAPALAAELPAGCRHLSYGMSPSADLRASSLTRNSAGGFTFQVIDNTGEMVMEIALEVPGEHNVRNALAAFAVARELSLDLAAAASALARFSGTGRRFDLRGEANGVVIIDDYAHHPTEIRATLAAARSRYADRRIWAVWQPHTYSRTLALLPEFKNAFGDADQVIVTAIYAAREKDPGFSAGQVVTEMPHPAARYIPALTDVRDTLLAELQPGDVVLVLSAGDADQVSTQILAALHHKEESHA